MTDLNLCAALAIDGFMTPHELTWLARQAQTCQTIIEVGSFCGRSTRAFADHCPGTVYCIDPWQAGAAELWRVKIMRPTAAQSDAADRRAADHDRVYGLFTRNLADHLASGRVVPIRQTSLEALPPVLDGLADLIFLDGDHHEATVRAEIAAYRPRLKPGGILAGHDYNKKGVKAAVDAGVGKVSVVDTIWWAPCGS